MKEPKSKAIEGVFEKQNIVTCIGETIEYDSLENIVYFDTICLNGTYKCQVPVGDAMKSTYMIPDWGYWKEIKDNKEMRDIDVYYLHTDDDNIVHLLVL